MARIDKKNISLGHFGLRWFLIEQAQCAFSLQHKQVPLGVGVNRYSVVNRATFDAFDKH